MLKKNEVPEEFNAENRILAESVFHHRTKMQESQEKFAEGCNMSTDMISLIERGMTNPSLHTIARIARHIGISVSEMLKLEEEKDGK